MQRLLLVANPSSSQFTGGGHRTVVRILQRRFDVETAWPQSTEHARALTAEATADGFEVVAAMGGDGVVHHVGHVLAGTETALAVIPTGTTNVYARLFGIPHKPVTAARLLIGAHLRRPTSVLAMDGLQEQGEVRRHALFAAGFGFDAAVVRAAEQEPYRKYHFGALHYARTAIGTLLRDYRKRRPHIRVSAGARAADAVAVLVQFQPVYTYFGRKGLRLSPEPPDPMSALVVEALPARRLPRIISGLIGGADLDRLPGMQVWTGLESVAFEADPPVWGQADGEMTGAWRTVSISLKRDALHVLVPPNPPR
ncbi:MAG TPA: diacylglycerol kinase family protein [Acidimicrobiia bacterium]|nr:diacylglycerol kinase family protein [Acidimicrobiia bacterium]